MKQVKLKSGLTGGQSKLRSRYTNFGEFERYCETYNIHGRIGFDTPEAAWASNPTIRSGVNPNDLELVEPGNKPLVKKFPDCVDIYICSSGGKAGKGLNKTGSVQVRKFNLVLKAFRYRLAELGSLEAAVDKAEKFIKKHAN